ncbi:MAG: hypothetical protein KF868_14555 [Acidobacteria bacterium]|nr:hypothetical protein [Acidobacteriota bacterium]
MPLHIQISLTRLTYCLLHMSLAAVFALIVEAPAFGQTPSERPVASIITTAAPEVPSITLPAEIPGSDWRAAGSSRTLTAEQLSNHPDAGIYREYGLVGSQSRTYARTGARLNITVYRMRFPSGAYGLMTFRRAAMDAHRRQLQKGPYLVSLEISPPAAQIDSQTIQSVENLFDEVEPGVPPSLAGHLPERDRLAGTETFIVGPEALLRRTPFEALRESINFEGGTSIAAADYRNGGGKMSLLIVEYHTPQAATAGHKAMQEYVLGLAPEVQEKLILKRTGNYLVLAADFEDRASAQTIVDEVKYTFGVYWEGKKFLSIPLEFRPPDTVAIEEATQTAKVLLQTFYGIGILLVGAVICGVFAGWAVFYWRRQRRRRLGLDNAFSDAGESVRLNLDDYVLQSGEQQIKFLGKGDD